MHFRADHHATIAEFKKGIAEFAALQVNLSNAWIETSLTCITMCKLQAKRHIIDALHHQINMTKIHVLCILSSGNDLGGVATADSVLLRYF